MQGGQGQRQLFEEVQLKGDGFLSASIVSLSFVMANSRSLSFQSHFAAVTSGVVGKLKPSFAVRVTLTV